MPGPSDDPEQDESLQDYVEQLEHALLLVANFARSEPELSLWCGRRVGELVLRCLHVHFAVEPLKSRHPSFQELMSARIPGHTLSDLLGLAGFEHLKSLQRFGNLGVHARRRGREEAIASVRSATHAIPPLVRALFSEQALGPAWMNRNLERHLSDIERGGRDDAPDLKTLDRYRARVEKLERETAILDAQLTEARATAAAQRDREIEARAQAAAAEARAAVSRDLAAARATAAEAKASEEALRRALAEKDRELDLQRKVQQAEVAAVRKKFAEKAEALGPVTRQRDRFRRKARRRGFLGFVVVSGLLVLQVQPWNWKRWLREALQEAPPVRTELSRQPAVPAEEPPPREVARPADEVAAAPAPPVCRPGTLHVRPEPFTIVAPQDQTEWPTPRSRIRQGVDVGDFCVDQLPASGDDLSPTGTCLGPPVSFGEPVPTTCVTRYQASARCSLRGGELAGIQHWEALARTSVVDELRRDLPREWVADSFPPAFFTMDGATQAGADSLIRGDLDERAAGIDARWTWNSQAGSERRTNLGYRCVYPVGG